MSNIKNDKTCLACKSTKIKAIPYKDYPFYGKDVIDFSKLQISYCEDCGFGYSFPEVNPKVIDIFYSDYYRANKKSTHYINFQRLYRPKTSQCTAGIEHLVLAKQFTHTQLGDNLLDIGPGPGWHFQAARSLLQNPKLYALEYSAEAAAAYKRLYNVKTYESFDRMALDLQKKRMKFIISSHSLEHLLFDDLKILLNQMLHIIEDDGVFVIEVPYVDMRIHSKIRGGDAPHFLFFSKESLRSVLIDSGYEVMFLETCGDYYNLDSDTKVGVYHQKNNISLLKSIYRKLAPLWFRESQFKYDLINLFHYLKNSSSKIKISQINVGYGGNRTALRAVIKKKNY